MALTDAAAHVFVDDLERLELGEADAHHLWRVLRLRPGEAVTVSDGAGRWRVTTVAGTSLAAAGDVHTEPAPAPILVGFAPVKGERPDWAVQKLVELGVDRIVPLQTDRGVVRWDARSGALDRLRRIAREAAMQSRRVWLADIAAPHPVAAFADRADVALAQRGGGALRPGLSGLLVGPEGGWSDAERANGLGEMSLGGGVLRTETAAVAAAVVLGGVRAGLLHPTGGDVRTIHDRPAERGG